MKFLLKICCLILINEIFFVNALEIPQRLKSYAKKLHDKCQKTIGPVEDLLQQAHDGHFSDDRTLQCYFHCLFDVVGIIDEKNIVHLDYLKDILPDELHSIVDNYISSCGTKEGADGCETAFRTMKCYFGVNPELFKAQMQFILA